MQLVFIVLYHNGTSGTEQSHLAQLPSPTEKYDVSHNTSNCYQVCYTPNHTAITTIPLQWPLVALQKVTDQ